MLHVAPRIAIVGTHGTGKTTLASIMADYLGVRFITEVARQVIRECGYSSTAEYIAAGHDAQVYVQEAILRAQIAVESEAAETGFVADRSVLDAAAYASAYGLPEGAVKPLRDSALAHVRNYSLLLYVPPVIPLKGDGFRDLDETLRRDVDRRIEALVSKATSLGVPVRRIESVTVAERMQEAAEAVQDALALSGLSQEAREGVGMTF